MYFKRDCLKLGRTELKKKILLGLTGNIGSGKSTALEIFRELGAAVLSSDEIVSGILASNRSVLNQMKDLLGDDIMDPGDVLNRKTVAAKVFNDPLLLKKLNAIIHPVVFATVEKLARETADNKIIVWEVPLLFETGAQEKCDYTLTLLSKDEIAAARVLQNRNIAADEFRRRKENQMNPEQQKSLSDFVIYNDTTIEELKKSCADIFMTLQQKLKEE